MKLSEIGWSRYKDFEGPFTRGTVPFTMPSEPTDNDRIMQVITATEGGRWNAVNMYDTCIFTVGLIQWCEGGFYLVSDLLGKLHEKEPSLLRPMGLAMQESDVSFMKNARGRYRFFFRDGRGEVDRKQEQRELFLLRSSGKRGSWDPDSKVHAKLWAASAVNVFEQPVAIEVQRDYTVKRLNGFVMPYAKTVMKKAPLNTSVGRAFRAAYLSFAANNPTWADRHLKVALESTEAEPWTNDWLVDVLRELTFGPNVSIYPHRYVAIRPHLERMYGVQLPDTSDLLRRPVREFMPVEQVQSILVLLGYDLGPYGPKGDGVDGVYTFGGKTYQAIAEFQRMHGIKEDDEDKVGWVGDDTAFALLKAQEYADDQIEHEDQATGLDLLSEEDVRSARLQIHGLVQRSLREYFASQHNRPQ